MVDFDDRTIDLSRENYDFAIRISPKLNEKVVAVKVGASRHHLCASPAYLAANGLPEILDDLQNHQLLHFGAARRAQWEFVANSGKPMKIGFQPLLNSNSGMFLLSASISGLGIVNLPDFISMPAINSGELVPVLTHIIQPEWGIFLVHAENRRLNRRMRLFAQEMKSGQLNISQHTDASISQKTPLIRDKN